VISSTWARKHNGATNNAKIKIYGFMKLKVIMRVQQGADKQKE
jgi:hypothetical protein